MSRKIFIIVVSFLLLITFFQTANSQDFRKDLEKADDGLGKAWMAKDADALITFYEDEATSMWTSEPLQKKKGIREFWIKQWKDPNFQILSGERTVFIISELGDLAFMQGTSSYRLSRGQKVVIAQGNWFAIWRRQKNGEWKILADGFNSAKETSEEKRN